MYGLLTEKPSDTKRGLFWLIMNTHIKRRSKVILNQEMIHSDSVFKNIIADLRRRKTISI